MPPRHPTIARALGLIRPVLDQARGVTERRGAAAPLRVLIGCSGGADSMALLGLLQCLQSSLRLQPVVAHVDHGLRAESASEAARVLEFARTRGLEAVSERLDLAPGGDLARRARDARRAFLRAAAVHAGCPVVALGHTATDQAETVLMHLARGAGLEGLAAMSACETDAEGTTWVRPLLRLTREETRMLAQRLELPIIDDPSNVDLRHPRVLVRQSVLPVLRSLRPDADRAIGAAADRAREAEDALRQWAMREILDRRRENDALCCEGYEALPTAVRTRVLRMFCTSRGADPDAFNRNSIETIDRSLCARGGSRAWDLHPGLRLRYHCERLWLEVRAAPQA